MPDYTFQQLAIDDAAAFLSAAKPGDRRLYAAPTGTGKSYMELGIQARIPGSWILSPRLEIIAGLLEKKGVSLPESATASDLAETAWSAHITTPLRYRKALLAGVIEPPRALIFDEGHHDLASTWQDIHLLCGFAPAVAFTATPYRGTPRGTAEFREQWGQPMWVITYVEAAARGVLSIPECRTVPLVDDDLIEVTAGELVVSQVTAATHSRMSELAALIYNCWVHVGGMRPTMVSMPSVDACHALREVLETKGVPAAVVVGTSKHADRIKAFADCLSCSAVLIQINVISEGVDLPIRRLIDASPTLSPVRWAQQLGRITRPTTDAPEYICTNRNLLRHGYLLEGCLPSAIVKDSLAAFNGPGKRGGVRVIGLEAIGRFRPAEVQLADGLTAITYSLSCMDGFRRTDYFAIVHPLKAAPIWAKANHVKAADGSRAWGKWQACDPPTDLSGFGSTPPKSISDKQLAWWERSAATRGLDVSVKPNRKTFGVLPVLFDLGVRL